jgi:hypothetical protein
MTKANVPPVVVPSANAESENINTNSDAKALMKFIFCNKLIIQIFSKLFNFYFNLKRDKGEDKQNNFNAQNLLAKISDLLIKLIPGESHDQKLFECVNSGFKFLVSESSSDSIENNLECILVLRILYLLGYVVKEGETGEFLENISEWNENLISKSSQNRVKIISVINKGIKESHLT